MKKAKDKIAFFDYIKFAAILLVIVTHCEWTAANRQNPLFPFIIDMAVPLFMLVSGFVMAKSADRQYQNGVESLYRPQLLFKRFLRYTIPYVVIVGAELILSVVLQGKVYSPGAALKIILTGGLGPGSYYYPVLIELLFLFPILFAIMKPNPRKGLAVCAAINFLYEVLVWAFDISAETYRLLVFRYIFVVACGIYCYWKEQELTEHKRSYCLWGGVLCLVGASFLAVTQYGIYKPKLFQYWISTNMVSVCFIFPIFFLLYAVGKKLPSSVLQAPGKASYHIFLVQMLYFSGIVPQAQRVFAGLSVWWVNGINIVVCILGGILFYYAEQLVRFLFLRQTQRSNTKEKTKGVEK